jgi:transcriptional regulator with XRE-family HTH domain
MTTINLRQEAARQFGIDWLPAGQEGISRKRLVFGSGAVAVDADGEADWTTDISETTPMSANDEPSAAADMLVAVRTAFPLQISQLAKLAGVTRPTIYAWLHGEQRPQERGWERLKQLHALARFWRSCTPVSLPEKQLTAPGADGQSIYDLLSADVIDMQQIENRLAAAAATHKPSWLENARGRGYRLPVDQPDSPEFDLLTRRSMDES